MSFRTLLAQTATITRIVEDGIDDYGNPVRDWEVVAADVPCRLHENPSTETTGYRDTVARSGLCFLEADVDVTAYDRLEIGGLVWEVDGAPIVRTGMAAAHHIEATVRQVTR